MKSKEARHQVWRHRVLAIVKDTHGIKARALCLRFHRDDELNIREAIWSLIEDGSVLLTPQRELRFVQRPVESFRKYLNKL